MTKKLTKLDGVQSSIETVRAELKLASSEMDKLDEALGSAEKILPAPGKSEPGLWYSGPTIS